MIFLGVLAALVAQSTTAPPASDRRVLLHTSAGDLVLRLFADEAPRSVEQFERLVRAGIYDGTRIFRVDPGFLVQTSLAEDRDRPLTTAQAALIQRIPLEPTSLHHGRGTVTFTHAEGDPDGGISALSILLGDAPQLDGKYVILGRVEDGYDVLDEIASVPLNARGQPLIHVGIQRAEIVTAAEAAAQRISRRALYSAGMAYEQEGMRSEVKGLVCAILFGVMAMSLLAARLSRRLYTAARLLILLGGGFGVMLVLLPRAQRFPLLGAALMAGLVALFKLLGRFEEPADEEAPSPSQPALSHSSYARKS